MITIRSSNDVSGPALIGLDATLTVGHRVYAISSNAPITDSGSTFSGGLFGAISWPPSRFQLAPGIALEQQMFLPDDGSTAAFSWQLHSCPAIEARLTIKPLFSGCPPRSYRDTGFCLQSEEEGGRLVWLPNVRGPKIIADTNGSYRGQAAQTAEGILGSSGLGNLAAPGAFEFELSERPSVVIFRNEDHDSKSSRFIGTFLAGLLPSSTGLRSASVATTAESAVFLVQAA
jgi:hypothetical protein